MIARRIICASVLPTLLACGATVARASMVFDFNTVFSGTAPTGSAPWLVATFSDTSTPGQVQLDITGGGLSGPEMLTDVYFNIDPSIDPTKLHFTYLSGSNASVSTGNDAFKADGDGKYDIEMMYPSGMTFGQNSTSTFDITYSGGPLDASSFDFLSSPAGGAGPFFAAAHVQAINGSNASGWVAPVSTVPLPPSLPLLAVGMLGFGALALKRSRGR